MKLLLILSIGLLTFGSGMSQNRYSLDEITIQTDFKSGISTAYLKPDMQAVNGIVYCEFGDMVKYVDGKMDGLYRFWHENGQLMIEGNYTDGKEDGLWRD